MTAAIETRREDRVTTQLRAIVDAAIDSLVDELVLAPKPGLVCPDDRGSHVDMDFGTMQRSIAALRPGFEAIVAAAARGARFAALRRIGIDAERAMRAATGGVNTHRGAIFNLGLLAAAAAFRAAHDHSMTPDGLRETLRARFAADIDASASSAASSTSHGATAAVLYGAGGARQEAIAGFPTLFGTLLPALVAAHSRTRCERRAALHVLMTSIASTVDTNLLYRGGAGGLAFAQSAARDFVERGGTDAVAWEAHLRAIGFAFVARNLSPGGSADLLAATLFVERLVERSATP